MGPHNVQVTPSDATRAERAAAAYPDNASDAAAATGAAAEATDNLRIAHVAAVTDDHPVLATLALRDVLAGRLRHHLDPGSPPLVVSGPFGTGKRLLLQRMLVLYPEGFQLVPVYTTAAVPDGSATLQHVEAEFLDDLEAHGLVAFRMEVLGHAYVASKADICECGSLVWRPDMVCTWRQTSSLLCELEPDCKVAVRARVCCFTC